MKDYVVIEAFVAYFRDNGYPDLCIDQRPEKGNRQSKDIDVIAGPFAIEHTWITTYQNQEAKGVWFTEAMANLDSELPKPAYELVICSEKYDPVKKGQKRSEIRNAMKSWITQEASRLPDGKYDFDRLPGIPFPLKVEKSSDGDPGIYFMRRLPDNNDLLPLRINEHLISKGKIEKLVPYKKDGFTTVLLIEGNLTRNMMLHTIKLAFPDGLHPDLDELWYVSTRGNHISNFTKLPKWGGSSR